MKHRKRDLRILRGVSCAALLLLSLTACGKRRQMQQPEPEEQITVTIIDRGSETARTETETETASAKTKATDAETVPTTVPKETEPAGTPEPEKTSKPAQSSESAQSSETVAQYTETLKPSSETVAADVRPDRDGYYYTKDDVALYIYTYGELPKNFLTKKQAEKLGWTGGSLEPFAPGCCIGGSRFGNYEGLLPEARGRTYTECDIDTKGKKSRGAKRIVFSNDGLIYYTDDHYKTFELLYGEVS